MLKQPRGQVRLTNIAVVRLKVQGKRFEVACFKNKILNWRSGIEDDINEVLQSTTIFQNVSKGKLASATDLKQCFGNTDHLAITRMILEKGDLQVSDKEREVTRDALFKDVATLVAERVFHRPTGLPLSLHMIQKTLNELGFSVVLNISVKRQALKALHLLLEKFPDEFCRSQMLLRARFAVSQQLHVDEYFKSISITYPANDSSVTHPDTGSDAQDPSDVGRSVTFYCPPQIYREVDHFFIQRLDPPGSLVVLSSAEHIVTQPSQESLQSYKENNGVALSPGVSTQDLLQPFPVDAPVTHSTETAGTAPSRVCRTCPNVSFATASAFRAHCKSEWHNFNVKRVFKKLTPITDNEYEELCVDLRHGFLAADS